MNKTKLFRKAWNRLYHGKWNPKLADALELAIMRGFLAGTIDPDERWILLLALDELKRRNTK